MLEQLNALSVLVLVAAVAWAVVVKWRDQLPPSDGHPLPYANLQKMGRTGDLLLVYSKPPTKGSRIFRVAGGRWCHVGLLLKSTDKQLFIYHSDYSRHPSFPATALPDALTGEHYPGSKLTPLDQFIRLVGGKVYWRAVISRPPSEDRVFREKVAAMMERYHGRLFDDTSFMDKICTLAGKNPDDYAGDGDTEVGIDGPEGDYCSSLVARVLMASDCLEKRMSPRRYHPRCFGPEAGPTFEPDWREGFGAARTVREIVVP